MESQSEFRFIKHTFPSLHKQIRHNLGLRSYRELVRSIWELATFDLRYGVRTNGIIPAVELDFQDREVQSHSTRYRASPVFSVRTGIASLRTRLHDFRKVTFVDYGCGAGRVMVMAAELGFGRVIGVDLSPSLLERCRCNLDRYAQRRHPDTRFDVVQENATEWEPPDSARVFFFFRPFDQTILNGVLSRIEASVADAPREVYLLTHQAREYDFAGSSFSKIGEVTSVEIFSNRLRTPH